MRLCNLFIIVCSIAVISFSFNCSKANQEQVNNEAEDIIDNLTEFWLSGNLDIIDDLFTEDCVYEDVPDEVSYRGRDEVRAFLGELFEWSPDLKVEYTNKFCGGDWAVVEWIWSGTQTGEIKGLIEATGKAYSIRGTSVLEFEKGKIKRLSDYYDVGRFLYQLGVKFVFPSGEVIEITE
jgi:steroid delta-isomerase-like uncharacterized protein